MTPPPSDTVYLDALVAVESLAVSSKRTYLNRLKLLQDLGGVHRTVDYLVRHPRQTYAHICGKTEESMTRVGYINAILTLFRHVASVAEQHPKEHAAWRAHLAVEDADANRRYENNEPTDKQRAAHVPWVRVLEARDALPKDGVDYLYMCCNTFIPPLRADFDRLAVRGSVPSPAQVAVCPNYLLIRADGMRLVLNEWKTRSDKNPMYEQELPAVLCDVIRRSLAREPRDYLFVQPSDGKPFASPNAYTAFVGRVLKRVLSNPHASQNTLRHSYIMGLPDKMRAGQRDEIARNMLHTPARQARYRLFLEEEAEFDPASMGLLGSKG